MKNIIKSTVYTAVALSSVAYGNVFAAINYNQHGKADKLAGADGNNGNIADTVTNFLVYILWFLALIAVIFAIYGWFQILTAAWDEDKVKKGKYKISRDKVL